MVASPFENLDEHHSDPQRAHPWALCIRWTWTQTRMWTVDADVDGGRGRELCVFGGLCVDM